jgi:enoyl-CoA hydratase
VALRRERVDSLFAGLGVEAIRDALAAAPEDWAAAALDVIRRGSPTSLKLTLRQLRGGRGLPIETTLALEYRLAVRVTGANDFREGVRSILIDKDNKPRWQPDRLEAVDDAAIERLFAPLAPAEPELGLA